TIAAPGPTRSAVSERGAVVGREVAIADAPPLDGIQGDCLQVLQGKLALESSGLHRCGGAALEAAGGEVMLTGVDAEGGEAGCLVLVDGARADLTGVRCVRRGPGAVAASGSGGRRRWNRWVG